MSRRTDLNLLPATLVKPARKSRFRSIWQCFCDAFRETLTIPADSFFLTKPRIGIILANAIIHRYLRGLFGVMAARLAYVLLGYAALNRPCLTPKILTHPTVHYGVREYIFMPGFLRKQEVGFRAYLRVSVYGVQ
jgi:hypothetical protein